MSAEILTDAGLWIHSYDLRGSMNAIGLQADVETRDCTNFGSGARTYAIGQRRVSLSAGGYPVDDATDAALFSLMGQTELPTTVSKARAAGELAFVGKFLDGRYTSNFSVSDVREFQTTGELSSKSFGRGRILHIGTDVAATANGTSYELRGISLTKAAYASLHVTAVSGGTPTLDVTIQSDDNTNFTTATTQGTFTQKTALGSQLISIAGPITDTWWRCRFVISGSTPAFSFAVALGFEEVV